MDMNRKERRAEINAAYYQANKEKVDAQQAAYNQAHKEEIRAWHAADYQANKEEVKARSRGYRQNNKEHIKEYRREHKPEHNLYEANRRALKQGALIGATVMQLTEIKEIYRRAKEDKKIRCYLCGRWIAEGHRHVDHILPLSKGGQHRPSNLAVACDSCNISKYDKLPQEIGLLL